MEDVKVSLRRYEDNLYVSGLGITVMGLWTALKTIMEIFLVKHDDYNIDSQSTTDRVIFTVLAVILVSVFIFIVLKVHFYIGVNAIRAAKGKHYKKGYYTATVVMLILLAFSMGAYTKLFDDLENIDTTLASLLVDVTTIYIFITVLISTNKLKKLKTGEEES